MKALFLSLDLTIRESASGKKPIKIPGDQQLIKGATEAIKHFADCGYLIIGITNQDGVAAGWKSLQDCLVEQQITLDLCPDISKIYFCPDREGKQLGVVNRDRGGLIDLERKGCSFVRQRRAKLGVEVGSTRCPEASLLPIPQLATIPVSQHSSFRKPGMGMIEYALDTHKIELKESLMVGGQDSDRQCAEKINCAFMWAEDWRSNFGSQIKKTLKPVTEEHLKV